MSPPNRPLSSLRGFSLLEMLVVVAIIGIITGIALPNIMGFNSQANFAKNERNAQMIAEMAAAARSAGATNQWLTAEALIEDLENTVSVPVGEQVVEFRIDPMSGQDRTNAAGFLEVDVSKAMVYYKPY